MLTADEIFAQCPVPMLGRSSRPILVIAIEVLPTLEDGLTADLVEHLALAIADIEEELCAVRTTLSASLELLHSQHVEIGRLQQRRTALLDELREMGANAKHKDSANAKHKDRTEEALREDKKREGKERATTTTTARTSTTARQGQAQGPMQRQGLAK